jgi:hypothetical protein
MPSSSPGTAGRHGVARRPDGSLSAHIGGLIPGHRYEVAVQTWNAAGGGLPNGANAVMVGG